jgi:hypothetical protein
MNDVSAVVEAILEVGRQRRDLLDEMRGALQSGDSEKALRLLSQYCGLTDEKSARTN